MLDADKVLQLLDAASISASKVFQVPATNVIKQKLSRHICRQAKFKYYMQNLFLPVLDAADLGDIGADGDSLYFY